MSPVFSWNFVCLGLNVGKEEPVLTVLGHFSPFLLLLDCNAPLQIWHGVFIANEPLKLLQEGQTALQRHLYNPSSRI